MQSQSRNFSFLRRAALLVVGACLVFSASGQAPEIVTAAALPAQASAAGPTGSAQLSPDGRFVLLASAAPNLTAQLCDARVVNLYVRDIASGSIELVSANEGGNGGGDNDSPYGAMSADGRFVAFESAALNLGFGGRRNETEIYLRDLQENRTFHVSAPAAGLPAGRRVSRNPSIAPDGSRVVYQSASSDIAEVPEGRAALFYVYDRATAANSVVLSRPMTGTAARQVGTFNLAMSGNGEVVAFEAAGSNVATPETMYGTHIFTHNLATSTTEWASRSVNAVLNLTPTTPTVNELRGISDNGQAVVWVTPNVTTPQGRRSYLLHRNNTSGVTLVVATNMNTSAANIALSGDGAHVAFLLQGNVHRWTAETGARPIVSVEFDGDPLPVSIDVSQIAISDEGRFVSFFTDASDILADDLAPGRRFYRRDMLEAVTIALTPRLNGQLYHSSMSSDGSRIAFVSEDPALVAGDGNSSIDAFLWNFAADGERVSLLSTANANSPATGRYTALSYSAQALSVDASVVVFSAIAPGSGGAPQIWMRDRRAGTTRLVSSVQGTSEPASAPSFKPMVSADGHWVAFETQASNIVPDATDSNGGVDVILSDARDGSKLLVTRGANSNGAAGQGSTLEAMSPNGRYLLVRSFAQNLTDPGVLAPAGGGEAPVYLWDRDSRTFTLITKTSLGRPTAGTHHAFAFSPDSQRAAFMAHNDVHYEHVITGAATTAPVNGLTLFVINNADRKFRGHAGVLVTGSPAALAFSPDGTHLVTSGLSSRGMTRVNLETWGTNWMFMQSTARPSWVSPSFNGEKVGYRLQNAVGIFDFVNMVTNRINPQGDVTTEDPIVTRRGDVALVQTLIGSETDTNLRPDIYAVNTMSFERQSVTAARGSSVGHKLSADNASILVASDAADLAAQDFNGGIDLFVLPFMNVLPARPEIAAGPIAHNSFPGEAAWLFIVAEASFSPLTYQWYREDIALMDGGRISGAQSSTLVIANAVEGDSGRYGVEIRNEAGVTFSEAVILEVGAPRLQVVPIDGAVFDVTWPVPSPGYYLEASLDVAGGWTRYAGQGAGTARVNTDNGAARFFRLRKD